MPSGHDPRLRSFNYLNHSQYQASFRYFLRVVLKSSLGIGKIGKEEVVVVDS